MNFLYSIPAIGLALTLSNCAPESPHSPVKEVAAQEIIPVGDQTSFIKDLRGARIDYTDSKGLHSYKLQPIGSYDYATIPRKGKPETTRRGIWYYKQTGEKTGQLILDGKETWDLKFISAHRASAKLVGSKQAHTLDFEWL